MESWDVSFAGARTSPAGPLTSQIEVPGSLHEFRISEALIQEGSGHLS